MDLGRYASREIMDTAIVDYVTATPLLYLDYALTNENVWEAEVVYATGGSGAPRRVSFHGSKTSTLTINTQIFTMQILAMLAGRDIASGQHNIFKREVLTVTDNAGSKEITLSKTPIGGANGVSVFAFVNGILSIPQEVTGVTGNAVTLSAGSTAAIGSEVEVYYQFQSASSNKLSFTAKDFPKYMKIYGNTLYADEVAGEFVPMQMTYHKVRLQPNFTLNMSPTGEPTEISMVYDVFPVKIDGVDTLADMVIYEE